jgi:hypothetical protein
VLNKKNNPSICLSSLFGTLLIIVSIRNSVHSYPASVTGMDTRVYPKVSGLAAWSENCKWYSSLPLGAVVSLFCESV